MLSSEPVVRPSMQMHRCLNDNLVRIHTIQKGIGKTPNKATPYVVPQHRPSFRVPANVPYGQLHLVEELTTKTI